MKSFVICLSLIFAAVASNQTLAQKQTNSPRKSQQSVPKPTPNNPAQNPPKPTPQIPQSEQAPKAQAPAALWRPFDLSATSLPANFTGHNAQLITELLLKKRKETIRDEFETSEQFQRRVAAIKSVPLSQGLSTDTLLAIVCKGETSFRYDADRGIMKMVALAEPVYNLKINNIEPIVLTVGDILLKREKYVATNAYGDKVEITRLTKQYESLLITNPGKFPYLKRDPFVPLLNMEFPMSLEKARQSKSSLRMLVVCHLVDPLVEKFLDHVAPTVSNPKELIETGTGLCVEVVALWIFDNLTGEVYVRLR